ncbi:MAG: N-acetylmuramoyl-L-alanine amidase [Candidatus Azobacteroides sp.]|nr:N-acetylmuramoyl-L-alanine amidase [Candidatus Azobacteroides sp.]
MKRIYLLLILSLCTSFVSGQEKDTPRKGEGIHAFLRRNNRPEAKQYEEFIRLNKHKLGKSNTLIQGTAYLLPPITVSEQPKPESANRKNRTGTNPLFGEKYKNYEIKDNVLSGACFYLVSGHGGPDPGAVAKVDGRELHEDEYAYDIILRLARNLLQHNATVYIIIQDPKDGIRDEKYLNNTKRETCMGNAIPLSQVARLEQRTNAINSLNFRSKAKYQRAIFIHLDSQSKKKQLDVFFYYQNIKQNKTQSLRLAETMRKTFRDLYQKHQPDRGFSGTVSTRPLYVLRNTTPISIFVELANMQNADDQKRYISDNNRQALANWLCAGFIKDYQSSSR